MYVPFESLPDYSRIWIYQAAVALSPEMEEVINNALRSFCEEWVAHGAPLKTSFRIDHSRFVILAVDEDVSAASGCSIDGSVRVLKNLKEEAGIDLLDRSRILFLQEGRVMSVPTGDLKTAFSSGILSSSTDTFNVQAASKGDYEGNWILPVSQTWMTRYVAKTPAV